MYGLAYLPEEDVFDTFKLVEGSCTTPEQRLVCKYFGETYVAKPVGRRYTKARYPPETWNLNHTLYTGSPHTNNPVEGFHNKLGHLINKDKVKIWDCIKTMKQCERKSEAEITRLTANQIFEPECPNAVTRKVRIKEKLENYNASNKLETLTSISYILEA